MCEWTYYAVFNRRSERKCFGRLKTKWMEITGIRKVIVIFFLQHFWVAYSERKVFQSTPGWGGWRPRRYHAKPDSKTGIALDAACTKPDSETGITLDAACTSFLNPLKDPQLSFCKLIALWKSRTAETWNYHEAAGMFQVPLLVSCKFHHKQQDFLYHHYYLQFCYFWWGRL